MLVVLLTTTLLKTRPENIIANENITQTQQDIWWAHGWTAVTNKWIHFDQKAQCIWLELLMIVGLYANLLYSGQDLLRAKANKKMYSYM